MKRTFLFNLVEDLFVFLLFVTLGLILFVWTLIIFPLTLIVTYSIIVIMKIRQGFAYSIAPLFNRDKTK